MQKTYKHLFFDLDHTLWDFDTNARHTLKELYHMLELQQRGVHDFDLFHEMLVNERLAFQPHLEEKIVKRTHVFMIPSPNRTGSFLVSGEWLKDGLDQS